MEPVLIITGAARGIDAACARLAARQGYRVAVNYARNRAAAETVLADIHRAQGTAIAVQADVADPAQARRLFETVDRDLGTVTALVNNAGITGPLTPVEQMDPAGLQDVLCRSNPISPAYSQSLRLISSEGKSC